MSLGLKWQIIFQVSKLFSYSLCGLVILMGSSGPGIGSIRYLGGVF